MSNDSIESSNDTLVLAYDNLSILEIWKQSSFFLLEQFFFLFSFPLEDARLVISLDASFLSLVLSRN